MNQSKYAKSEGSYYLTVYDKKRAKHVLVHSYVGPSEEEAIAKAEVICQDLGFDREHVVILEKSVKILIKA